MSDSVGDKMTLRAMLGIRSVRLILISRLAGSTSNAALAVAAGKLVFDMTGSTLDLGFIGLAEFLPTALLVLVAGSLADRYDRRIIASISTAVEAAVAVGLVFYVASDPTEPWILFLLVGLFGTARGFANPATRSIPPLVAPDGELPRLMSTYAATWQMATVIGPVLAGMLYAVDPVVAFASLVVLLVVSAVTIQMVEYERPQEAMDERPTFQSALDGLRFVRSEPILLAAISLDLFAVLLGGAVALAPALAEDRFGVGAVGLGWLRAAGGIGAAATAIALSAKPLNMHVGKILLVSVGLFGLGTIGLGMTTSFWMALVLLGAIAAVDMVSVYIRVTIVPLVTPDKMRGRVLAVEAVFIGASNELGAFESGVTAAVFGLVPAIIIGGVATIVVVFVFWFAFPAMRDINTFDEIDRTKAT